MASNPTGFKINYGNTYPATTDQYDLDDVYIRRDKFKKGGLWIWGSGGGGQLGNDLTTSRSSPVQTCISGNSWRKVCVSKHDGHFALALTTTGQVWGWGCNDNGQVALSPFADSLCPRRITCLDTVTIISAGGAAATAYSSGVDASQTGIFGTGAAADYLGEYCRIVWGCLEGCRTGKDSSISSGTIQDDFYDIKWVDISLGNRFGIGIADYIPPYGFNTPGVLMEWGCGKPSNTLTVLPNVLSSESWKYVAAGNTHAMAIKCDGTLWVWGCNHKGQLGTDDTVDRSLPVQLGTSNSWTAITAGCNFSAAILAGDFRCNAAVLYTWGENTYGQLGVNSTTDRSSPTQVSSSCTNWKKISGGDTHFAALQTDGTAWTWGSNEFGELGRGDRVNRSSPVQILGCATGWYDISAGQCATSGLNENAW